MLWVRLLVYGFPVLIVTIMIGSFVSVKFTPVEIRNEMMTGGIGEARILNPIQSTTGADSEVNGYIFEGLLQYSEDIEIIGNLATTWELSQTTAIVFSSPEAAAAAAAQLSTLEATPADWELRGISVEGTELTLRLGQPGKLVADAISALLTTHSPLPIEILTVSVAEDAQAALDSILAKNETSIVRSHLLSSRSFELTVAGDSAPVIAALEAEFGTGQEAKGSWEVVESATAINEPEVRFFLRDDVRWHDGEPFTAEDVAFTYRMIMDESIASARRSDYELLADVEVIGPHEVLARYRRPYSPALNSWMIGLLPKHILDGKPSTWWAENFNRAPIGTGPFKFDEWRTNEFIRLTRNEDYYLGAPNLESVVLRTIPDPVTMRLAFETGQVDFWQIPSHAVANMEDEEKFEIFSSPSPSYDYVGWNLRRPIFQDIKVRQAMAHAVNVDAIIEFVLYGHGTRSTGMYPPQVWFFNDAVKPFPYDPERAKELLAEAGWTPGPDGILEKDGKPFSFYLITNQGNEVRKDIATLVQADLRKIGIDVQIQIYEWAVFISQYVNTGDFDAVVLGWSLGYDFDQFTIWHSSQTNPGQLNFVGYENAAVDRWLNELRSEFDTDRIKEIAGNLQAKIYEDQPYLFVHVPSGVAAMWRDAYRVSRPVDGIRLEEPVRLTNIGFRYYNQWFYRPEHGPNFAN